MERRSGHGPEALVLGMVGQSPCGRAQSGPFHPPRKALEEPWSARTPASLRPLGQPRPLHSACLFMTRVRVSGWIHRGKCTWNPVSGHAKCTDHAWWCHVVDSGCAVDPRPHVFGCHCPPCRLCVQRACPSVPF